MIVIRHDRINTHVCHSQECADLVSQYILKNRDIELEVKENDNPCFYDPGGMLILSYDELSNLDFISVNNQFLDIAVPVFKNKKPEQKDLDRGFVRFSCYNFLLCLTLKELENIQKFIQDNKENLEQTMNDYHDWFMNKYKEKSETTNSEHKIKEKPTV